MSRRNVVEVMNQLFVRASTELYAIPITNEGGELRGNTLRNLTLGRILNSDLSGELKGLIAAGFAGSEGNLQLRFFRHRPKYEPEDYGQMTLELSGRDNRIGVKASVQYDERNRPIDVRAVPATTIVDLSTEFASRPEEKQEDDIFGLMALVRSAIV